MTINELFIMIEAFHKVKSSNSKSYKQVTALLQSEATTENAKLISEECKRICNNGI